eukprot:174890_1
MAAPKTMMKAIRCTVIGDPLKSIQISNEVEIPKITKNDQVLVKVHYASINPVDWKHIAGQLGFVGKKPPYTPGGDFSGCVVTKGKNVKHVNVGDLVYGLTWDRIGVMAEYTLVKSTNICKIPSNINTLQACAIPMVSNTSYQCLKNSGLKKGGSLLILGGTTACGLAAIQIAKNHIGCRNITVTSSQKELCKSLGADMVINYKTDSWKTVLKDSKFDVVYDCVGGQESWNDVRSENIIKSDGYFVTIVGDKVHGDKLCTSTIIGNGISLINRKFWGAVGNQKYELFLVDPGDCATKNMSAVNKLVADGKLKPILDKESPFHFDNFMKMFEKSLLHKARGKLVLEICMDNTYEDQKEEKDDVNINESIEVEKEEKDDSIQKSKMVKGNDNVEQQTNSNIDDNSQTKC